MDTDGFGRSVSRSPEAVLLVGFGDLSALARDFRAAFPGLPVFTARSAAEGLGRLSAARVFVQPVYLLPGAEFERLRADALRFGGRASCGTPLLSSPEGVRALAEILARIYTGKAVLFAGHGSRRPAGKRYADLEHALRAAGLAGSFVGVLEGEPGFDRAAAGLAARGIRKVSLVPLMLSLGMHVRRQILGGDGSWSGKLEALGVSVCPVFRALLDEPAVRSMLTASARPFLRS